MGKISTKPVEMKRLRLTQKSSRRGAFTIIAAVLISAFVISIALSTFQLGVFQQNFRYQPAKEIVTEVSSDLDRALTHALSIVSKNYSSTGRNETKAKNAGLDYISLWQRSVVSSHSNLGLQMNILPTYEGGGETDVSFILSWDSNPGYSQAYTKFKLNATNYGFTGWIGGDEVIRILNVTGKSFESDPVGNTTSFRFSLTNEKGKPIPNLSEKNLKVEVNNLNRGWETPTIKKIQYLGAGEYKVVLSPYFPLQFLQKNVTVLTPGDQIYVSAYLSSPPEAQVKLDAVALTGEPDQAKGSINFGGTIYSTLPALTSPMLTPFTQKVEYTPENQNQTFKYWKLEGDAELISGNISDNPVFVKIQGDANITAYYSNEASSSTTSTTSTNSSTTTTTTSTSTNTTTTITNTTTLTTTLSTVRTTNSTSKSTITSTTTGTTTAKTTNTATTTVSTGTTTKTTTGVVVTTTTGTTTYTTTRTVTLTTTGVSTSTTTGTTSTTTSGTTVYTTSTTVTLPATSTTTVTNTGTTTYTTTNTVTHNGTVTTTTSTVTSTTTGTSILTTTGTTTTTITVTSTLTTTGTTVLTTTGTTTSTTTYTLTTTTTGELTNTTTGVTTSTTTSTTTQTTYATTTSTSTGTTVSTTTGTVTITSTITTPTVTTIITTKTTVTTTTTTVTTTATTPRVSFHSSESTGLSHNLGAITLQGIPHSLPYTASLPVGTYSINYIPQPGYNFLSWEISDWTSIQLDSTNNAETTLHVLKDGGYVTAIYSQSTSNGGGGVKERLLKLYITREDGGLSFTLPTKDGHIPSYTSHGNNKQALDLYITLPSNTKFRFDGPALLYFSVSQPRNAKNLTVTVEYRAQGETTFTQVAHSEPVEVSRHGANAPILYVLFPDNQGSPVNPTWWGPGGEVHIRAEVTYDQAPYGVVQLHYGLPNPSFVYITTSTP